MQAAKRNEIKAFWLKYDMQIITILAMLLVGTLMHFVFDVIKVPGVVKSLGFLFPVGETLFEHMKMLWYPFLGAGVILSVKEKDAGYFGAFVIGGIVAMLAMTGTFVFYQSITLTSVLALDISLYTIIVVSSASLSFLLAREPWCKRSLIVWIVVAILMTAIVIFLTYYPGQGYLFQDGEGA